jgi:hypothetical protein
MRTHPAGSLFEVFGVAFAIRAAIMKNTLLSFAITVMACGSFEPISQGDDPEPLSADPYLEAEADLENGLAYDGCTWLVTIAGLDTAPSVGSRAVIEAYTTNIGTTKARIRYRLTGSAGSVECGWNTSRTLPEIEIASIDAP